MNIITGNFGNGTIALLQWAYESSITNVYLVYVNTGWAAKGWEKRVKEAIAYAEYLQFKVIQLVAKPSFAEQIVERARFPSQKFQWCAGFLKGLPLLTWLDEHDPRCLAPIIMARRPAYTRHALKLQEFNEESEHYGGRTLWCPLYKYTEEEIKELVARSPLSWLTHRSLECDPCIHSTCADFARLDSADVEKTAKLEQTISGMMFEKPIVEMVNSSSSTSVLKTNYLTSLEMGCGNSFGCGD